jgi:hypothetical protein
VKENIKLYARALVQEFLEKDSNTWIEENVKQ